MVKSKIKIIGLNNQLILLSITVQSISADEKLATADAISFWASMKVGVKVLKYRTNKTQAPSYFVIKSR